MDIFGNAPSLGEVKSTLEEYEHPGVDKQKGALEEDEEKPSFSFLYILCVIVSLVFIFRLLELQVVQGAKHQYLAEGNRIRSRSIPAPRGIIYDKNGVVLAQNTASFNLELYPAYLPQDINDRNIIYKKIEEVSQISAVETKAGVEKMGLFSVNPVILKENLTRDEALLLKTKYADSPGVIIDARPSRSYDTTLGLSHILGYIGKISQKELDSNSNYEITSWTGKNGVELTYEKNLMGGSGKEQVEVDSKGKVQRVLADIDPKPGNGLYLGVDLNLQKEMAKDLQAEIDQLQVKNAVAIAMDPRSGAILGMVSLPSYDNNIFAEGVDQDKYSSLINDPNKPLINRAISGLYPSGSTVKPFIAAAGLQEGVISENTTINDATGSIKVGDWIFPDWKIHGVTDVRKAIAESCDVFFYAVGGGYDKVKGLGAERIDKYLQGFGFGQKTGIDLSGDEAGLVPSPDWKKKKKKESWYLGDTYHLSIGQGDFLTTPLQLLTATSAIANGGELLRPHLATKITDMNGNTVQEIGKEVVRKDFIDSRNIGVVREGMRQAVTSGSARQLGDLPVAAAGKTGTAQFDQAGKDTHSWFTAFAPFDNPEIALVILVESGGEGNSTAVPVAKNILQWYFNNKTN